MHQKCTVAPITAGDVVPLEFLYELENCSPDGGVPDHHVVTYAGTSLVGDEDLEVVYEWFATNVMEDVAVIVFRCKNDCLDLMDDFDNNDYTINVKHTTGATDDNGDEIWVDVGASVNGIAFNFGSNTTFAIDATLDDYSTGRVKVSVVSTGRYGIIYNWEMEQLQKGMKVVSFDACHESATCTAGGYSLVGGEVATVTLSENAPADLVISIINWDVDVNGRELCGNNCDITFSVDSPIVTFVVPEARSYMSADHMDESTSVNLYFSGNSGNMFIARNNGGAAVTVEYRKASTPVVSGFTPASDSYTGGDVITLVGTGFTDYSAPASIMQRGKSKSMTMYEIFSLKKEEKRKKKKHTQAQS